MRTIVFACCNVTRGSWFRCRGKGPIIRVVALVAFTISDLHFQPPYFKTLHVVSGYQSSLPSSDPQQQQVVPGCERP